MTVWEAVRATFRHRRASVLIVLGTLALAAVITSLAERVYQSEGRLFIRLGRENAVLDPTVAIGQGHVIAAPLTREPEMNSVIAMLKTRGLAEKVVKQIGLEAVLGKDENATSPIDSLRNLAAHWGLADLVDSREKAVLKILKKLDAEVPERSNVVVVTYEASSPEQAQVVLDALMEAYVQQHIASHREPHTDEFLSERANRVYEQLQAKQLELETLKTTSGVAFVEERKRILETRVGRLEEELLTTEALLTAVQSELVVREQEFTKLPAIIVTADKSEDGEALEGMREQLYALEVHEKELLSKYLETHPMVTAARGQVVEVRKILDEEERKRSAITHGPNRAHEEAQIGLVARRPLASSYEAKLTVLASQLKAARQELKPLVQLEQKVTDLQREVDLLDTDYRQYHQRLHQASVERELDLLNVSNIAVVQPATLQPKPVRPIKLFNLGIGLMLGIALAAGTSLLLEERRLQHNRNDLRNGENSGLASENKAFRSPVFRRKMASADDGV